MKKTHWKELVKKMTIMKTVPMKTVDNDSKRMKSTTIRLTKKDLTKVCKNSTLFR